MRALRLTICLCAIAAYAQRNTGELRLTVEDPAGLRLRATADLRATATNLHINAKTGADGRFTAGNLPFGTYELRVEAPGFAPHTETIEIRSEIPIDKTINLGLASTQSTVTVYGSPLLDTSQPSPPSVIAQREIQERSGASQARAVPDLVASQPGWIVEANSVLHPRGSEYQTQFVVNGMPITENRSPAFGPSFQPGNIRSMDILTAGYPAEYGRKLGGVVELDTATPNPGLHGQAELDTGSFSTLEGFASAGYTHGGSSILLSGNAGSTARYLDPPARQNYNNTGTYAGATVGYERDFSDDDRLRLTFRNNNVRFEVPNELIQQQNGQRQDRTSEENAGYLTWQHIISSSLLASVRGSVRDVSAGLWSNTLSLPIAPFQDRDFREGYAAGTLAAHFDSHELKFGVDGVFTRIDERFSYRITDPAYFDSDVPPEFLFSAHDSGREYGAFAQDLIRAGNWTISAGLRYDAYHLLVSDHAWSPRLGVAWGLPSAGLVLRASYDRAFQTPAIENLLLASSNFAQHLPVPPSRGDFFQAGFGKALGAHVRLESNWFLRAERNFADDDVFLNTGVSFPISFERARIHGIETKLESPQWGRFSGFVNWSWLVGTAWLPVTGGLFLEPPPSEPLTFPITQDQRNTAHARLRWQATNRFWTAAAWSYGSGLPIEFSSQDLSSVDPSLLSRVNLDRGRVRPSTSLDLSAGVTIKHLQIQAAVLNLTNRLNLINFASLFSGTAIAVPRSFSLRVRTDF